MERGQLVLRDPQRNLDSAFTADERQKLGLRGLLPPAIIPMDIIQKRTMLQFEKLRSPLEKYVFLMALQASCFPCISASRFFCMISSVSVTVIVIFHLSGSKRDLILSYRYGQYNSHDASHL